MMTDVPKGYTPTCSQCGKWYGMAQAVAAERDEARAMHKDAYEQYTVADVRLREVLAERDAARADVVRLQSEIQLLAAPSESVGHIVLALRCERDEARAELARLKAIHLHGCECSTEEACQFATERDEAIANGQDVASRLLQRNRELAALHARLRYYETHSLSVVEAQRDAALALLRKAREPLAHWIHHDEGLFGLPRADDVALLAEIDAMLEGK